MSQRVSFGARANTMRLSSLVKVGRQNLPIRKDPPQAFEMPKTRRRLHDSELRIDASISEPASFAEPLQSGSLFGMAPRGWRQRVPSDVFSAVKAKAPPPWLPQNYVSGRMPTVQPKRKAPPNSAGPPGCAPSAPAPAEAGTPLKKPPPMQSQTKYGGVHKGTQHKPPPPHLQYLFDQQAKQNAAQPPLPPKQKAAQSPLAQQNAAPRDLPAA